MTPALRKMVRDDCLRVLGEAPRGIEALQGGVVLMTGGTGFMGTWVAEATAFLNDHYRLGIRLLLLSPRASQFAVRAPHLATRKDIQLIEQNVLNIVELPEEVNWIIHAAGDPDGRSHATDPVGTLRTLVRGTDALLQAASRLNNLRKVLHVSSGLVYGSQPRDMPGIAENFVGGLDCAMLGHAYAEGKRVSETICAAFRSQMRLPIVTVRPFAFLGPYQLLDRPWAANNFIRDSLLGGPVRIQGDGQSVRSYMYPADMAWWLLTILARGSVGSVYNVGSPNGISLADLAEKIAAMFSQPIKIVTRTLGLHAAAATRLVPDVAWAEESLGLTIKTDLDTAVRQALQWYRAP
jgi:dTDP-glucose 4,6-dehydratase